MKVTKFDRNRPYRYVRYGRMSSDLQNPRSPEQQFATCSDIVTRERLPWVHVADYRDDGISARLIKRRPGLQKLLADIRSGRLQIDLIVVDTFERFGRTEEAYDIRRWLQREFGILIVTADTNYADPTGPTGQMMGLIENIRASEDNRIKSHNVRRGKRDSVRQKQWPGGRPSFGYKLEPVFHTVNGRQEQWYNRLVIDDAKAWIVRLLFAKALETAWGQTRLAKWLNAHPDIPAKLKPFQCHTVAYILRNAIYVGDYVFSRTSPMIVEDRRVNVKNEPEDMLVVPDFCDALIERDAFDQYQALRALRGRALREALAKKKGLQPAGLNESVIRGATMTYPLTGLVVCGCCDRAMDSSPSPRYTATNGEVRRYVSYVCPVHGQGQCPNGTRIPEAFIRERVADIIRLRVFGYPAADSPTQAREAQNPQIEALIEEVQKELAELQRNRPSRVPVIEAEMNRLSANCEGRNLSLVKPDLPAPLRASLEAGQAEDLARLQELRAELEREKFADQQTEFRADPKQILESLDRLAELLGGDNATATNIELGLHIHSIKCFPDDRIIIRTCRLGALTGVIPLLREEPEVSEPEPPPTSDETLYKGKPRRRGRRAVQSSSLSDTDERERMEFSTDVDRFKGLPDKWFWEDEFQVIRRVSWAKANADDVAAYQVTNGATLKQLATAFDRSIPTIRAALQIAEERRQAEEKERAPGENDDRNEEGRAP